MFVLDANAFIQAKRRFYGLDFCPGYWDALAWHRRQGRLVSIDKVRGELEEGADELWTWAEAKFGAEGFADTSGSAVVAVYRDMLTWVMAQTQFLDPAKTQFQAVADGWLAAYAKTVGGVVVTLEEFDPVVRKEGAPAQRVPRLRRGTDHALRDAAPAGSGAGMVACFVSQRLGGGTQ